MRDIKEIGNLNSYYISDLVDTFNEFGYIIFFYVSVNLVYC